MTDTRQRIQDFLRLNLFDEPVNYNIQASKTLDGYLRHRIVYDAPDGDTISAYLLIPDGEGAFPAVLIHHQHAGQRHLGKSEVVGIAGDPLQAFAPELAQRGFIVLVPDSICFEDRRKHTSGYEPFADNPELDWMNHFVEMHNRLTTGDTLMRKVLSDASVGLSLLTHHPQVDASNIGIIGHSYGGNTTLFQAALESPRIRFAVSSGALCSYQYKRDHDYGLEFALIIPDFATHFDMHDLITCIAPCSILIVSATEDPYSMDAAEVIKRSEVSAHVTHERYDGTHALTQARFNRIIEYVMQQR